MIRAPARIRHCADRAGAGGGSATYAGATTGAGLPFIADNSSGTLTTSAMKRYPRFEIVSMKRGDAVTRPQQPFRERLYGEMLGHLKETDSSAPVRRGICFLE